MPLATPEPPMDPRALPPGWKLDLAATNRVLQQRILSAEQKRVEAEARCAENAKELVELRERYRILNLRLAKGTAVALGNDNEILKARVAELEALEVSHVSTIKEWKRFEEKALKESDEFKRKDAAREKWAINLRREHNAQIKFLQQQHAEQLATVESDTNLKIKEAANASEPLYAMATQLQEQVQDAHERQHDLEAELSQAQVEKQSALAKAQVLEAAVDASTETIAAMQRSYAELEAERDEALDQGMQSAGAITHLRDALDAARAEVDSTKAHLNEVAPIYQQATATIHGLNDALDRSAAVSLLKEEKILALTADIVLLRDEVTALKKEVREEKKKRATAPPPMPIAKRTRTAPARYGL